MIGGFWAWALMHARYLKAVLRHKWFVLVAGYGRVPLWRLLIHDWSKFTPSEWGPYARAFYGAPRTKTGKPEGNVAFDHAWMHHLCNNDHHWQAWLRVAYGSIRAVDCDMMFEDSGNRYYLDEGQHVAIDQESLGDVYALPMPSPYREEMLADWRGANRAYGDQTLTGWYAKSKPARILHPDTEAWLEGELHRLLWLGLIR